MVWKDNGQTSNEEFSAKEYFSSLEKWVQDTMLWQHLNYISFQSFVLNQAVSLRPPATNGLRQPLLNFRNTVADYNPYHPTAPPPITGELIFIC